MPSTRAERLSTLVRVSAPWRRMLPNRTVRRTVQGVDLYMPWSHLLPDYAATRSTYGQNLVELAVALAAHGGSGTGPLQVLDIGANIGDSAAQIMAAVDARVLCVEGDPYWATYLQRNLGAEPRATIAEMLLTPNGEDWKDSSPVRVGGTTHFVQDGAGPDAMPRVTVEELRRTNPGFEDLRLVKSDTDGFDAMLVPAVASVWADAGPVLFFEFDPILTRAADDRDPNELWERLADLGYDCLAVWDNGGDPLGRLATADAAHHAVGLEPRPVHLGYHFWDVAACRSGDLAAVAAFDAVMTDPFDARGTRR